MFFLRPYGGTDADKRGEEPRVSELAFATVLLDLQWGGVLMAIFCWSLVAVSFRV